MHIIMVFVDGLGIGCFDRETNPCADPDVEIFANFLDRHRARALPFGGMCFGVDATLGVAGIPQSATGQSSLLTGVNAARLAGGHRDAFPTGVVRELVLERSVLRLLKDRGETAAFVNAYRPSFFELGERVKRRALSATTLANLGAGLRFFGLEEVAKDAALYHDLTNESLIGAGFEVPERSPARAGEILAEVSRGSDFTLFEYFRTDMAGHRAELGRSILELLRLEEFVGAILEHVDLDSTLLLVSSDHGNIEDASTRDHTINPAMFLVWGATAAMIAQRTKSLTDVVPALLDLVGGGRVEREAPCIAEEEGRRAGW
jgi:2,3-bisphosphoglycerate-independent phosphoglycerate mutase